MAKKVMLTALQEQMIEAVEKQSQLYQTILDEVYEIKRAVWNLAQKDRISYTIQEAANATGLSYDTMYSYFKTGKLPGTQVAGKGGSVLIMRSDLEKLLLSNVRRIDEEYSPKKKNKR